MIIRREGTEYVFITQPDHAALSRRAMERCVELQHHPRAASILLAIGEQNDARIDWFGQRDAEGPRLLMYATLASCEQFTLPADSNSGNCAVLARAGWTSQGIATTLILSHGRGNPERLGTPPEYKLWITSDRSTTYNIAVSYFYGPDC